MRQPIVTDPGILKSRSRRSVLPSMRQTSVAHPRVGEVQRLKVVKSAQVDQPGVANPR